MGRWGWSKSFETKAPCISSVFCDHVSLMFSRTGLFASEMDLDCYSDLVHQILSLCTSGDTEAHDASHKSDDSCMPDEEKLNKPGIREELDDYLCDALFKIYRKRDDDPEKIMFGSQVDTIFLGVAMMEAGATISKDNLDYLRSIARAYGSWTRKDTKEPGKFAHGMYNTGQAQIVTAIDLYQAGIPRNFHAAWSVPPSLRQPSFFSLFFCSKEKDVSLKCWHHCEIRAKTWRSSCFHCGKSKADIQKDFIKCSRCNMECWCDEVSVH